MNRKTKNFFKDICPNFVRRWAVEIQAFADNPNRKDRLSAYKPTDKETIIVMGNGPSLNKTIKNYMNVLKNTNLMCVNYFADTDFFSEFRPEYYVLADPAFFETSDNNNENQKVENLINALCNKTNWKMILFVSAKYRKSSFVKRVSVNPFILFRFYSNNSHNCQFFYNMNQLYQLMHHDMVSPFAQNVLQTCLSISIFYSFKRIYFVGGDMSMHEQLMVDQTTNQLVINDRHFYSSEKKHKSNDSLSNMSQWMYALAFTFKYFEYIEDYSKQYGCKIYNASEFSYVDAFERRSLSELEKKDG